MDFWRFCKDIFLDRDTMTAYRMTGLDLKENQYYIAEDESCLTLNDDGTFTISGEYSGKEDDFGDYTMYYIDKGTYEKTDLMVTCTFSSYNERLVFDDPSSLKAYREMYTEMYENGYIARVDYEYYMGIVLDEGYDGELSETVRFSLEPHTQTAICVDPEETEL